MDCSNTKKKKKILCGRKSFPSLLNNFLHCFVTLNKLKVVLAWQIIIYINSFNKSISYQDAIRSDADDRYEYE